MQTYKYKLNVGILINLIQKKPKKAATTKLVGVKWCEIKKERLKNGLIIKMGKNALSLSVNAFSTNLLIGTLFLCLLLETGTTFYRVTRGPAICREKAVPSFLRHSKTLSVGRVPGIKLATSRSAVKRSTD